MFLLASVLEDSTENVITLGQGSPPYPMYLLPIVEASWTSAAYAPKILYNQASLSCNQPKILFWDIQCPHGSLFNSPSSVNQRLRVLPIVQMSLKEQPCPVIRNVPFTSFTPIYHFLTNVQSMAHLNLVKWFNLSLLIRALFCGLSLKYL